MKLSKNNPIVLVTNALNKHGKIKGKDKKETKKLKTMCVHHVINKKGKVKPKIYNNGSGECNCDVCSHAFRTQLFTDEQIEKIFDDTIEVADQGVFMAVSVDAGEDVMMAFVELKLAIANVKKAYRNVRDVVRKQDKIKNKGKKGNKDNRQDTSSQYGGWN